MDKTMTVQTLKMMKTLVLRRMKLAVASWNLLRIWPLRAMQSWGLMEMSLLHLEIMLMMKTSSVALALLKAVCFSFIGDAHHADYTQNKLTLSLLKFVLSLVQNWWQFKYQTENMDARLPLWRITWCAMTLSVRPTLINDGDLRCNSPG